MRLSPGKRDSEKRNFRGGEEPSPTHAGGDLWSVMDQAARKILERKRSPIRRIG